MESFLGNAAIIVVSLGIVVTIVIAFLWLEKPKRVIRGNVNGISYRAEVWDTYTGIYLEMTPKSANQIGFDVIDGTAELEIVTSSGKIKCTSADPVFLEGPWYRPITNLINYRVGMMSIEQGEEPFASLDLSNVGEGTVENVATELANLTDQVTQ